MDAISQIALQRAISRRQFLRSVALSGVASRLYGFAPTRPLVPQTARKVIVVTFGGGARDEETFAPEGQENIPHLIGELIPQATFFTQVVNRGILGHYVATASLATGLYETFDNFADVAPGNPTVFEYFRKGLDRPPSDAWVIAPSNGFNRIGQSDGSRIKSGFGAEVVLPKRLLTAALGRNPSPGNTQFLLQDNFEDVYFRPDALHAVDDTSRIADLLHISFDDFARHASTLSSADELSVYILRQVMRQYAPGLIWITLHDMDVAHTGAFSLYLDGIRRSDRLCAEIWQNIQSEPEYKDRTTMLVLPDFGRDSDLSPSGNGFQHHRTGDPLSRTTWMMALGPHIRQNTTVDRPLDSLDLVPTIGALMGFATPFAAGAPAREIL
ncbi:MAG TPA: hypothetical protein VGN01_21045 [Acidobacteriaceae bacterium]|jgi:hypothetical protein